MLPSCPRQEETKLDTTMADLAIRRAQSASQVEGVRPVDIFPFLLHRPEAERREDVDAILHVSAWVQGKDAAKAGVAGLAKVAKTLLGEWVSDLSDLTESAVETAADSASTHAYESFTARGSKAANVRTALALLRTAGNGILLSHTALSAAMPACNVMYRRLSKAGLRQATILVLAAHRVAGVMQYKKWGAALADATAALQVAYAGWMTVVLALQSHSDETMGLARQQCRTADEEDRPAEEAEQAPAPSLGGRVKGTLTGTLTSMRSALLARITPSPSHSPTETRSLVDDDLLGDVDDW